MFDALFVDSLTPLATVFLVVALLVACGFEFVNGFHDTANAVATVIYTNALRPWRAVVLSGVFNFIGVLAGGITVAIGIIKLLPTELLVAQGSGGALAMVMALLGGAILWNLGTWFFGLPASSSHTLIGAIIGVGLANSLTPGHAFGEGVNWSKAGDIGLALLLSPLFGFSLAALLFLLIRNFVRDKRLFEPPPGNTPPPLWIRILLIGTCSGVSFAHGQNDGQKGVGLIMLILVGIAPGGFALDLAADGERMRAAQVAVHEIDELLVHAEIIADGEEATRLDASIPPTAQKIDDPRAGALVALHRLERLLDDRARVRDIPREERFQVRQAIMLLDEALKSLGKKDALDALTSAQKKALDAQRDAVRGLTDYAPRWVLFAVALSLGIGTMVGWKRIVVTVGEKIGKAHLTYAQGAAAELVAASTIYVSGQLGLPVSTTHVLSSGIAGTMVAQKSGLQRTTVRNVLLAWVMTLPASMLLSGGLFLLFRLFV
jgi:PiT family inorganic phosphate transporter